VGIAGGGRQIDFAYDGAGGAPHAGVFGTTGSGKTVTIQSILAGQLATHTPDELGVIILDPHRDFEAFDHSAHLVAPIAHTLDDIANTARLVDAELARRIEANERDGQRWLVVIDEATRALARESEQIVVRAVVSEARKFKINLLLGAQNAADKELPGIVRLVNNRFVGLVANAQVSSQLTGQAGLEAHKLTGAGDFLHVVGADIARLQVAMATDEDLAALPRVVEVPRPVVAPVDTPATLKIESSPTGRPAIELEGRHLAAYLHYGIDEITEQQAREVLALKRKAHRLHRDYAGALVWLEQLERRYAMGRYPSPVEVARCMVHGEDVSADVSAEARKMAEELLAGLAYLRDAEKMEEEIDDATGTE
jgi:DNA segregation ATPase FtsK/SpoIIIE-like protein